MIDELFAVNGVRRGEAVIPRPVVRGPMAVALPRSRSPVPSPGRFGCASAGCVDCPQAMGTRHRPGTAPGPAGDRLPPFAPSTATHARTYSGEIESLDRDQGIATVVPEMRFPGN